MGDFHGAFGQEEGTTSEISQGFDVLSMAKAGSPMCVWIVSRACVWLRSARSAGISLMRRTTMQIDDIGRIEQEENRS
jgi:hypothetical protein